MLHEMKLRLNFQKIFKIICRIKINEYFYCSIYLENGLAFKDRFIYLKMLAYNLKG